MSAALSFSTPAAGSISGGASELVVREVSGSHVLTINGYSHTKRLAVGDSITAGAFAAAGHRWSILYYPNGSSYEFEHSVSLYLQLDPTSGHGPDVKAGFRFSLLGVDGEPVKPYTKSCDDDNGRKFFASMAGKRGFPRFIRRSALEQSGCLVDDCFRIRCDITVLKVTCKDNNWVVAGDGFVVVPPSTMDHDLGHLLSSEEGANIWFQVDEEMFAAHKNILAARSPVFAAEFFSPMEENVEVFVCVDDMEARLFGALLHFVYTDALPEIEQSDSMVMAQDLLVAADRFSMERLKLICEDSLCSYIDTSTVGTILGLAEQHGCHGLKKACFQLPIRPQGVARRCHYPNS